MGKKADIFLEWLNIISSFFMIGLLIIVLIYALSHTITLVNYEDNTRTVLYYLAIMIAYTTVIVQWVEGRTKSMLESLKGLKGGSE